MNGNPTPPPRPILARAGENGFIVGLMICGLVLCAGLSTRLSAAVLLLIAGTACFPVVFYRMLRRSNQAAGGTLGFPEIWAEGIGTFFLGTLLPGVFAYVCLRFVWPGFIAETVSAAIEAYRAMGTDEAIGMADLLESAVAVRMPTAADVTAQLISFNIITGTVLSLVTAIIVKANSMNSRLSRAKENNI